MSARIATVFRWRTTFGGYRRDTETATTERKSTAVGGVRYVEANAKAHTAPQELCENLINALKLLVNQQTDGDSPIQSIVTGVHERTSKGITDGLSFIEIDNHSAVDVGYLCRGLTPSRPEAEFQ